MRQNLCVTCDNTREQAASPCPSSQPLVINGNKSTQHDVTDANPTHHARSSCAYDCLPTAHQAILFVQPCAWCYSTASHCHASNWIWAKSSSKQNTLSTISHNHPPPPPTRPESAPLIVLLSEHAVCNLELSSSSSVLHSSPCKASLAAPL